MTDIEAAAEAMTQIEDAVLDSMRDLLEALTPAQRENVRRAAPAWHSMAAYADTVVEELEQERTDAGS